MVSTKSYFRGSAAGKFCLALLTTIFFSTNSQSVNADVLLDGGVTLVEQGGAADFGNLAQGFGAVPFAKDVIAGGAIASHQIDHLNDGLYGNANSWIGGSPDSFAGIGLGTDVLSIQSIAFGRSNVTEGDPCGGGVCTDRNAGLYTLQFTAVANPDASTVDWTTIGTLNYGAAESGTNFSEPWRRHRYNFDAVDATGLRLIAPNGAAIDEIELYADAGALVEPPAPPPAMTITPAAGFSATWDGNDGDHFDPVAPPEGAVVPDNLALASNGATPFTGSDLGPQLNVPFHRAVNLNDGVYGNSNSWIGGEFDEPQFAGVALGGLFNVESVAWSRDNGNGALDGSAPGTDCCGGQVRDRSLGTYTLQITTDASPGADSQWTDVAQFDYDLDADTELGGAFTSYFRHQFEVATEGGDPIMATGVRLLVPTTGIGGGTAIDEIEVYGTAVPEPSTWILLCLGMLSFVGRRVFRRGR